MDVPSAPSLGYLRSIWAMRWFWYSLVENDLATRYRHSWLGIGWSLARPLGLTIVFCVVFGAVFQMPIATYAPYVLTGLTLWQFIVETTTVGCRSFQTAAPYIRQQVVPLAMFPLRTALGAAFHAGVALLLVLAVTWWFQGFENLKVLPLLVPSLVLLFILGWSLATVSGIAQTHFPDTCYILELLLQFLFYLTPIIYRPGSLQTHDRLSWVVDLNPLWSVLELVRRPVLDGTLPSLYNVAVSLIFVGGMAALALFCLRKLERRLVFWI